MLSMIIAFMLVVFLLLFVWKVVIPMEKQHEKEYQKYVTRKNYSLQETKQALKTDDALSEFEEFIPLHTQEEREISKKHRQQALDWWEQNMEIATGAYPIRIQLERLRKSFREAEQQFIECVETMKSHYNSAEHNKNIETVKNKVLDDSKTELQEIYTPLRKKYFELMQLPVGDISKVKYEHLLPSATLEVVPALEHGTVSSFNISPVRRVHLAYKKELKTQKVPESSLYNSRYQFCSKKGCTNIATSTSNGFCYTHTEERMRNYERSHRY